MDRDGVFAARLLDSALHWLAASTVVRQRERMAPTAGLRGAAFDDLVGDTESRILHLGEALATGHPALFVEQIQWSRSTYGARGIPEDALALNLTCLREVLARELPPTSRGRMLAILDQGLRTFEHPARPIESVLEGDSPHRDRLCRLLLAVLEARRDDALQLVLGAARDGVGIADIEMEILAPLQAEIGRMWQRGEIQVHEEHLVSSIVEEALALLRGRLPREVSIDKSVLVCSVAGNLHDIGSRIVADHFEMRGWNALRLGANLPSEDLGRATVDFDADLVALSVTMTSQVRNTAAVIEDLRSYGGAQTPPILVGGPPFALVPDLWRAVEADGCAPDAPTAVREGLRLVGLE